MDYVARMLGEDIKPNQDLVNTAVMNAEHPEAVAWIMQQSERLSAANGTAPASNINNSLRNMYPILNEELTLKVYFESLLDQIQNHKGGFLCFQGVYIKKDLMESLENWADWKMLKAYLGSQGLTPIVVFKNELAVLDDMSVAYLADIRLLVG